MANTLRNYVTSNINLKFCILLRTLPVVRLEQVAMLLVRLHLEVEAVEFESHGCNPAIAVPTDSSWLVAAREALTGVFDREALLIGTGGSIPAVGSIRELLGIDSLLVGFGLDDDNVHAPNEKFELTCLHNGIRSHAAMLAAFGALR